MSHLSVFQKNLTDAGFDAAIISDKINQRYLSGFDFDDGLLLVTAADAYLLTDFRYAEAAEAECSKELRILLPEEDMLACIRELLAKAGAKRIAIEEAHLSFGEYQRYVEKLSDTVIEAGASKMLETQRQRKDDAELDAMARAQAITDAAFTHILSVLNPNMTEIDVALEIEFFMKRQGAESLAFSTIAVSGSASSLPHGVPRRQKLERGFLTMDFGARVDG